LDPNVCLLTKDIGYDSSNKKKVHENFFFKECPYEEVREYIITLSWRRNELWHP